MKTYNLFISHSWSYSDAFDRLRNLLDNRPYFSYRDYSVPKDEPIHTSGTDKELYEAIVSRMRPCHIVVIMAGVYSTYSKWINKEIRAANKGFLNPKPIIGVKPWGQTNVSSVVVENVDVLVGWNTESVVNAVRRYSI